MPPQKPYKVLLIGDSCVDRYIYGTCKRLNPEAPVPILEYDYTENKYGMAFNVRTNLKAFGIHVDIITQSEQITKTRFVDMEHNQQLLRVDNDVVVKELKTLPNQIDYDAVVISDYDKGFISTPLLFKLVNYYTCPVFIDSKKNVLPTNAIVKINADEANKLHDLDLFENLIITKGGQGAEYMDKNYPGIKVNVFDVVGAGDTFFASLVYFYLEKGSIEEAIPFANKAAAIAVQHFGTYVLTEDDINEICN